MYFKIISIIMIITLSLCHSIPIKVLQDLFCINCKKIIQREKEEKICNSSNKYANSILESIDLIHCSHVKQCYEMCNKKWKYYKYN